MALFYVPANLGQDCVGPCVKECVGPLIQIDTWSVWTVWAHLGLGVGQLIKNNLLWPFEQIGRWVVECAWAKSLPPYWPMCLRVWAKSLPLYWPMY